MKTCQGLLLLLDAIPDMRALLLLSLQSNSLCAAGGKALADGLKDNQVITELNISSNRLGYCIIRQSTNLMALIYPALSPLPMSSLA
jgi:hypothetical protein